MNTRSGESCQLTRTLLLCVLWLVQEQFQHCVEREDEADDAGPRISLVFKQSLVTIPNRRKQKDHGRD